jgi:hypothetical protein
VTAAADEYRAAEALRDANISAGNGSWILVRRLGGGFQSGAWLLESSDRTPAVLKFTTSPGWVGQVIRAGRAVGSARAAGYPTPEWLASGITSSGIGYQVQAFVAGSPRQRIGVAEATALVGVLERQVDLDPDPGRSWSDFLHQEFGDGFAGLR